MPITVAIIYMRNSNMYRSVSILYTMMSDHSLQLYTTLKYGYSSVPLPLPHSTMMYESPGSNIQLCSTWIYVHLTIHPTLHPFRCHYVLCVTMCYVSLCAMCHYVLCVTAHHTTTYNLLFQYTLPLPSQ